MAEVQSNFLTVVLRGRSSPAHHARQFLSGIPKSLGHQLLGRKKITSLCSNSLDKTPRRLYDAKYFLVRLVESHGPRRIR